MGIYERDRTWQAFGIRKSNRSSLRGDRRHGRAQRVATPDKRSSRTAVRRPARRARQLCCAGGETITTNISLAPVRTQLERSSCSLEQLWLDYGMLWQQLGWHQSQVRLWARCLPTIQVNDGDPLNPIFRLAKTDDSDNSAIADQMVDVLTSHGRPMPLNQLMNKLPSGAVLTEPMLRSIVAADSRMQITGPLVRLI